MNAERNSRVAQWIIDTLFDDFEAQFFVAPGARSSPLVNALSRRSDICAQIHFDERSLGFAGLGSALACGKPAVCITTSGTAVANLYPSVIEAHLLEAPLMVLSADRPGRLRGTGANQTIWQEKIFGRYARFLNWPAQTDCDGFNLAAVQAGCASLMHWPTTPFHLNMEFDEPLLGQDVGGDSMIMPGSHSAVDPPPYFEAGEDVARLWRTSEHAEGWLVVGGLTPTQQRDWLPAFMALAECLDWPVFCDVTSGWRPYDFRQNIHHYDLTLRRPDAPRPKIVWHIGERLVSKRLLSVLQAVPSGTVQHISRSNQPLMSYSRDPVVWPIDMKELIPPKAPQNRSADWLSYWRQQSDVQKGLVEKALPAWSEMTACYWLGKQLGAINNCNILIGNSMPIRHLDSVLGSGVGTKNSWLANRGASGIDGNLSTLCGACLANRQPGIALLGDLTLLHDINAFALGRSCKHLVIVVLNNSGGQIFRLLNLPVAEPDLRKFWATEHAWQFQGVAKMFGWNHDVVESMEQFKHAWDAALSKEGHYLIEASLTQDSVQEWSKAFQKLQKDL
ncbi:MAG: 2-succinyl-5-enolpyruvyl-6-hydroxy-3-cyclohexene-1-carboxylic-acid synthase [Verrucomicrobiales bacterium]